MMKKLLTKLLTTKRSMMKKNNTREANTASTDKANNNETKKGLYVNDYSPKFSESYNIYDKAREHMKKIRKEKSEE